MTITVNQNHNGIMKKIEQFIRKDKIAKKLILDISQEKIIMRRLKGHG